MKMTPCDMPSDIKRGNPPIYPQIITEFMESGAQSVEVFPDEGVSISTVRVGLCVNRERMGLNDDMAVVKRGDRLFLARREASE